MILYEKLLRMIILHTMLQATENHHDPWCSICMSYDPRT